jgi:hypothetical protein
MNVVVMALRAVRALHVAHGGKQQIAELVIEGV